MSDPAVEAAARFLNHPIPLPDVSAYFAPFTRTAIDAAREALKPIRELHQAVTTKITPMDSKESRYSVTECGECAREWPCETAHLVYSAEELS